MSFLLKNIIIFIFFPLFSVFGNSEDKGKCREVFSNFLSENHNETSMRGHLRLIKKRGYPTEVSKSLLKLFEQSTDPGVRGMIGRVLGENRLARYNKKKIVSLMIHTLKDGEASYLEIKGMVRGLGYLLKPKDKIEIRELAKALNDESASVRKETALALGRIKPKNEGDIERVLIEVATDSNEEDFVREASILALKEILSPQIFRAILKKYKWLIDTNPEIRQAVVSSPLKRVDSYKYEVVQSVQIQELYQRHMEEENKEHYNAPQPFGSWSEMRIFLAVHKKGYFVIPQFEAMGDKKISYNSRPYRIDLVIIGSGGKKLAVEYDGDYWHSSKEKEREDTKRQQLLKSLSWEFWRISEKNFRSQPEQTLENLWKKLDEMSINPLSKEIKSTKSFH